MAWDVNRAALLIAFALLLNGCGSGDSYPERDVSGDSFGGTAYASQNEPNDEREPFDEDAARERAEEEVRDDGYSGPCTIDCSGHDAGFEWAADGNPDRGISRSRSFDEGQEAYEGEVEDRVEEYRQAHEDGEDVDY